MVDTVRPLQLSRQAMQLDDPAYPLSWIGLIGLPAPIQFAC